jgi:glycolate oxidase FAD binding subunit
MLNPGALDRLAEQLAGVAEVQREGERIATCAVRGLRPSLVCVPASPENLAAALAICDRADAKVVPWGGGSQQRLGMPPRAYDVALVVRALDQLVEFEPANLTATVQAGTRLADLQTALSAKGQWLPYDPPVSAVATIGGLLATNPSGPHRLKVGGLRDLLLGTVVATPFGSLAKAGGRVVKNVTGYDLDKLYVGSLGTLGIVVEATFKTSPRPASEATWYAVFASAAAAGQAVGALRRTSLAPSGLEVLNDRAATAVGLPVPARHWALLGRASGFQPAVKRHLDEFARAARAAGAIGEEQLDEATANRLWPAYTELAARQRWQGDVLTCRLALPPESVGRLADIAVGLGEEAVVWAQSAGAVFWTAAGTAAAESAVEQLRSDAQAAGGALVVENYPAAATGLDVWGAPGGPLALMKALKREYDPRGTLNPGRYIGGI